MHTAALEAMGLAPEWTYEAIDVPSADFERLVLSLADQDFAGVNVTVPHKVAALDLADDASDGAREIGAANTLSFREGLVSATNTDATGVIEALPRRARGMRALVVGAGGSARAAVWALRGEEAEVFVWNRTAEKAESIASDLGVAVHAWPSEPSPFDLIVNATTVGMSDANPTSAEGSTAYGQGPPDLKTELPFADALRAATVVIDLVYGTNETSLARAAKLAGATYIDGFEVLVRQGAASLEGWVGTRPPLDVMRHAARKP